MVIFFSKNSKISIFPLLSDQIIDQLEERRSYAREKNRAEYARKLQQAITALEAEGLALGVSIAQKRKDISEGNIEEARERKEEIERRREEIHK